MKIYGVIRARTCTVMYVCKVPLKNIWYHGKRLTLTLLAFVLFLLTLLFFIIVIVIVYLINIDI